MKQAYYKDIPRFLKVKVNNKTNPTDSYGERGIRTLDPLARMHAFQACALDHYATPPFVIQFYTLFPHGTLSKSIVVFGTRPQLCDASVIIQFCFLLPKSTFYRSVRRIWHQDRTECAPVPMIVFELGDMCKVKKWRNMGQYSHWQKTFFRVQFQHYYI